MVKIPIQIIIPHANKVISSSERGKRIEMNGLAMERIIEVAYVISLSYYCFSQMQ